MSPARSASGSRSPPGWWRLPWSARQGALDATIDPAQLSIALAAVAVAATLVAIALAVRRADPFLDVRLFRSVAFSSAALVSLLTGYAFATAIIGGAVFVDRVLYGGPDEQRLALGALAGATALGALAVRVRRPRSRRSGS